MDQRALQQLNQAVYATYDCIWEPEFAFVNVEDAIYHVLAIEPMPLNETEIMKRFPAESVAIAQAFEDLRAQLAEGDQVENLLQLREDHWVLNKGKRVWVDGVEHLRGVLIPLRKIKAMFETQRALLEEYEEKLTETAQLIDKDSLTGLLNTRATRQQCEEYLAGEGKNLALMIIDVDGFKCVNDIYGHMVGDHALIHIAEKIKKVFRANDIVGRIGGDEFLVLMKDVEQSDIVQMKCKQILAAFAEIECDSMEKGSLNCSIGVAISRRNTAKYETLFCFADKALYCAKDAGRGCYTLKEIPG